MKDFQINIKLEPDRWTIEPSELQNYGKDWTKVFLPNPCVIFFPRSTAEVVTIVKWSIENQIAIVPSGGRTGLAGGAVATNGEAVISFRDMRNMGEVDAMAQTVRVEAGAVTEAVHIHCAKKGLTWPVDFASKGSSTIGGNISTNAGGIRVIRYGSTRAWVLGLQVVTAAGEILELNGALEKNNTGMDLKQCFIGTEGTLGIITEATLKLTPVAKDADVFFFSLASVPDVLRLFTDARKGPFTINAFETLTDNCLKAVLNHRGLYSPLQSEAPVYVVMEIERSQTPEKTEAWLNHLFEDGLVIDGVMAQSPREASEIWSLREGIAESLAAIGMNHKHDISVPIAQLDAFISALTLSLNTTYRQFDAFIFGHIGDGNLHINIIKPSEMSKETFLEQTPKIDLDLFKLIQSHQGSVSAEHGVGLLKRKALPFSRSETEINYLKQLKSIWDPNDRLNPGKIL